MEVFRITLEKWSNSLSGSGYPARWNSKGVFIVYTSGSRALASLENVVHRSGEGLNKNFRTMVIDIPQAVKVLDVDMSQLPEDWFSYKHFSQCQDVGDDWIMACKSAVMKVPSAIIKNEHNYLLNPVHPDFTLIKLKSVEDFEFDPRIKA